ncbi:MAG: tRNA delta(2)-isopentenylpyrophosphate transferase, tRNA dimethylallyltransferase [Candidatus Parcubacteria bacterium]|jgi:tRNA dimethylallyltransferase
MSLSHSHNIIVVAGPTASGKSDFAVKLAQQHNGEIISADSRQVYRGLDIGTGKITSEEMGGIPHHMLDVIDVGDPFSVAEYARLAQPILEQILARGKTPIICGGTGQYIDALIYNTPLPGVSPNETLREELEKKDVDELFRELAEKDPYRADTVDRYNKVRLIRALEIVHELGYVPQVETPSLLHPTELYLMHASRDLLRNRITKRLEKRLALGMIEEVRGLMTRGYTSETMKKFGIEYEVIGAYLEGTLSEDAMKEMIITKSMQYAKRQETWNKKYLSFAKLIEVL